MDKILKEYYEERDQKLLLIEQEIRKYQDEINNGKSRLYSEMTREDLEKQLQDAKMAIFKLWYIQHSGKKYED